MLPKLFYEALPYSYLATGTALMMSNQHALPLLAGLLLYTAGALCWSTRARYRQRHGRRFPSQEYRGQPKSSTSPIDNYRSTRHLPVTLYEGLPFGYLLAGLFSYQVYLQFYPSYLSMSATILFVSAGLSSWLLRGYYRGYHQNHSPVLND